MPVAEKFQAGVLINARMTQYLRSRRPVVQKQLFVIAKQGNQIAAITKSDKFVDHAATIGATTNVVTQGYNSISEPELQFTDECAERQQAAVYIANCDDAVRHATEFKRWLG